MNGDCKVRSRLEHLALLREHYDDTDEQLFPNNPDAYDWKFGEDGTGEYNMLEYGGIPCVLRRGSYILYLGRAAHEVPEEHALFDYANADADEQDSDAMLQHSGSSHSDNGEHTPDAPDAVAPPEGQYLWVMKVDDVLAVQRQDGLWCTYVMGTTFVTRSYMENVYAQNVLDRLAPVLSLLHPRQHVKTDLWDIARLHNLVGDTNLWSLASGAPVLPPPVGAITSFRVWVYPGRIIYLADDTHIQKKRGAVFRGGNPHLHCICVACREEYLLASDIMAYCSVCSDDPAQTPPWYHQCCASPAPILARLTSLCVNVNLGQGDKDVEAPAICRAPSQGPAVWVPAPRGIRVRIECPVRTWERILLAVRKVGQEQGQYNTQEENLSVFRSFAAYSEPHRFRWEMPDVEVQHALQMDTDGSDGYRLLFCPACHAVM